MFSLSQMSDLVISLINYNKIYVSLITEEESEKGENEEINSNDNYYFSYYQQNYLAIFLKDKHLHGLDIKVINSFTNKPETPPPDFC